MLQATVAEKVHTLRDAATDNGGRGRTEGPLKEPIPPQRKTAGPKFCQMGRSWPFQWPRFVFEYGRQHVRGVLNASLKWPKQRKGRTHEERDRSNGQHDLLWKNERSSKAATPKIWLPFCPRNCKFVQILIVTIDLLYNGSHMVLNDHFCACANHIQ